MNAAILSLYSQNEGTIDLKTAQIMSGVNAGIVADSSIGKPVELTGTSWHGNPELTGDKIYLPRVTEFKLDVERTLAKLNRNPLSNVVSDIATRHEKALTVYSLMPHLKPEGFDQITTKLASLA
jgi:hypothetical protein